MTPILSSTILRTQSDARLLALASRGGTDGRGAAVGHRAFEAIVERYRRPLLRWCRAILPEARAEDAVQTAFLKAWAALEGGAQVSDLRPWLYRIARNAALDNARRAGYDYDELSDALRLSPAPDDELERRTVIRETLTGVAGLPDNQREALLRTASGQSRAEIARDLHVTEGAVRQLVHRARSALRAAATAVTPMPLVNWASALGAEAGTPAAQRFAELAAAGGGAGIAAGAVKAGTVVVAAGVLAAGPGADLREEVVARDAPASSQRAGDGAEGPGSSGGGSSGNGPTGAGSPGSVGGGGELSARRRSRRDDSSGPGSGRSGREDDDSSGPGRGGSRRDDDSSGPGPGGSRRDDDDSARRGSSGSGRSGSGRSGGDDSSGGGSSGSGRSGSGRPDDDDPPDSEPPDDDSSGRGSSGSGSSGSGSSGSGSSGRGSPDLDDPVEPDVD